MASSVLSGVALLLGALVLFGPLLRLLTWLLGRFAGEETEEEWIDRQW